LKRYNQAVVDLLEAVTVDPKSTDAFNSLAWLLATCPDSTVRNGIKATEYIGRALQLDPNKWALWDTRAAVFAENGDFENAVKWEQRCLQRKDLSQAERHKTTERLALYRARKPYREEPKSGKTSSQSNQSMKPTAPDRNKFSVIATTPCRGLSPSR
jgi:tetratricopeptide (TPR) repeat protein